MIMPCLGLRTALQCGRGDRAPPREPPSRYFPGFPRKARELGLTTSRRGGLRTPARKCQRPTDAPSPLGGLVGHTNPSEGPGPPGPPSHAPARVLRENHRSRHLRPFPTRPSWPGWSTPRRGGLRTPANQGLLLPVRRLRQLSTFARPLKLKRSFGLAPPCNTHAQSRPCGQPTRLRYDPSLGSKAGKPCNVHLPGLGEPGASKVRSAFSRGKNARVDKRPPGPTIKRVLQTRSGKP